MKVPAKILVFVCIFVISTTFASRTYAFGDPSVLHNPQSGMTDSVNTLNQLGSEEEEIAPESKKNPQDIQEQQYQDDIEREQQEWEESRTIDEYRYDVPE